MRGIGVTVSIGSLGEAVRPLGGQVPCDCLRSQLPTAKRYFFLYFRKGHGPLALKTPIRSFASHQFHPLKTTTAMKLSFIAVSVCITMHFLFFQIYHHLFQFKNLLFQVVDFIFLLFQQLILLFQAIRLINNGLLQCMRCNSRTFTVASQT